MLLFRKPTSTALITHDLGIENWKKWVVVRTILFLTKVPCLHRVFALIDWQRAASDHTINVWIFPTSLSPGPISMNWVREKRKILIFCLISHTNHSIHLQQSIGIKQGLSPAREQPSNRRLLSIYPSTTSNRRKNRCTRLIASMFSCNTAKRQRWTTRPLTSHMYS